MSRLLVLLQTCSLLAACSSAESGVAEAPIDPATQPGGEQLAPSLVLDGRYELVSTLDLVASVPSGAAKTTVQALVDMTDGPNDPGEYLLAQSLVALPEGYIKTKLQEFSLPLATAINTALTAASPTVVTTLKRVGNTFGDVTKKFGLAGTLQIANGTGTLTVDGLQLELDQAPVTLTFADHRVASVEATPFEVNVERGRAALGNHQVGLKYGQLLRLALDGPVVSAISPAARNLEELLLATVQCQKVGEAVAGYMGSVGDIAVAPVQAACETGLRMAVSTIYDQLNALDAEALALTLTGTASVVDTDRNGVIDGFNGGLWSGEVRYIGVASPLVDARFYAKRLP